MAKMCEKKRVKKIGQKSAQWVAGRACALTMTMMPAAAAAAGATLTTNVSHLALMYNNFRYWATAALHVRKVSRSRADLAKK